MQMRKRRAVQRGSRVYSHNWPLLIAATAPLIALGESAVQANTITSVWSGSSNTTWSNSSNWDSNGPPSATVGAQFSATFTNQPNLTAAATADGLWMTTGVGQSVTINATTANTALTLGGATMPTLGTGGGVSADLLMNDAGGNTLTFGPNIKLTFSSVSTSALNINNNDTMVVAGSLSTTNGSGPGITGDGTGTLDVTGNLVNGGGGGFAISNAAMILEQNNSSVTAGLNVYTGGLLRLNAAGAVPAGENCSVNSGATLLMRSDTNATFTGNYSFSGSNNLLNLDRQTVAGSNNTILLNGTVSVTNGATLNLTSGNGYKLAISGNVNVGNTYSGGSTFNPSGTTMSISGNVSPGTTANVNGSETLFLAGNTAGNSISGNVTDSTPASGTPQQLVLQKSGSSSWTLSGANAYSGGTSVNAGTLLIDGNSSAATGAVSVASTGTLGGNGTVGGATTVNSGGLVAPGDGTGTLTFIQSLLLNSGAAANFGGNDLASVDGTLTLNSGWKLNLESGFQNGGSVTLFTFGSAGTLNLNPTIDTSNLGFTPSGSLSLSEVGDTIVLNGISVVPEPASASLLVIGGTLLLTRRRRSR